MEIEALRELAKSSFSAGSYKDSYKYSSSLIEINPSQSEAWLIKGLSAAALMVEDSSIKVEEVIFSLDRSFKGQASINDAGEIQAQIEKCYGEIIKGLEASHKEKIVEHHKVPMPAGGSALLHRVAQTGYARLSAKSFAPKRLAAIKLLEKSYSLDENESSLKALLGAIDAFHIHSSGYSDYLKDETEITSCLVSLRSSLVQKAQAAGIAINAAPPAKSGCFIATAATGDYDHPKVLVLRSFRDEVLESYRLGRVFVRCYYKVSPPIALKIQSNEVIRMLILNVFITPLTYLATLALDVKEAMVKKR